MVPKVDKVFGCSVLCNRIAVKQADTKDVGKHYFQTKTIVEDNDVRDMLTRLYNLEFMETGLTDRKSETSMSREDHKFMKILQEGTKLRNGHFQVSLPFKDPCVNLSKKKTPGKAKVFIFGKKIQQKLPIQRGLHQIYEGYNCKGLYQEISDRSSFWKDLVLTP